jgi:NADH dehydrogenase FAD-containing subunit
MQSRPRVIIIGGGFGGLSAAHSLRSAAVDVLLIDRGNHHTFQPLLYPYWAEAYWSYRRGARIIIPVGEPEKR